MGEWMLLRPWWLLALIPLSLMLVLLWRRLNRGSQWESVVDPALREYVLETSGETASRWPVVLLGLLWLLCIIVLSGPVWERRPAPAYRSLQSLVVALDLSRSMDADDIKPSRIARAKHKLTDLLDQADGMQIGLVVFSESAYVVSPLTDDVNTLKAFLPSLQTSVVPVQGSKAQSAIEKSLELLEQTQVQEGAILLITDAPADDGSLRAASYALEQGYRVSILGTGSLEGGPIKQQGGNFLQDSSGNIVVAKLDEAGLRSLANSGGGAYASVRPDDSDLETLRPYIEPREGGESEAVDRQIVQWIERAPLLLLLLVPFAVFSFRRGVL